MASDGSFDHFRRGQPFSGANGANDTSFDHFRRGQPLAAVALAPVTSSTSPKIFVSSRVTRFRRRKQAIILRGVSTVTPTPYIKRRIIVKSKYLATRYRLRRQGHVRRLKARSVPTVTPLVRTRVIVRNKPLHKRYRLIRRNHARVIRPAWEIQTITQRGAQPKYHRQNRPLRRRSKARIIRSVVSPIIVFTRPTIVYHRQRRPLRRHNKITILKSFVVPTIPFVRPTIVYHRQRRPVRRHSRITFIRSVVFPTRVTKPIYHRQRRPVRRHNQRIIIGPAYKFVPIVFRPKQPVYRRQSRPIQFYRRNNPTILNRRVAAPIAPVISTVKIIWRIGGETNLVKRISKRTNKRP